MSQILLVEDETYWFNVLKNIFVNKGYDVSAARNYDDGLGLGCKKKDELLLAIIDLDLSKLDNFEYKGNKDTNEYKGFDLILNLREKGCRYPIIVVSGNRDYRFQVYAHDIGARNFIEKQEITAQRSFEKLHKVMESAITEYLDSGKNTADAYIRRGPIKLINKRKIISVSDRVMALSPSEYDVLYLLMKNQAASVDELIEHTYESRKLRMEDQNNEPRPPTKNCVENFISSIRKKVRNILGERSNPIICRDGYYRICW